MSAQTTEQKYDVFLSHPHTHADWVEALARRLKDEGGFVVWLDKWVLVPGESFQRPMARGLDEALSCAVFVGAGTPSGWFQQEIQKALNRQARDSAFRVIPVLMPDADESNVGDFLELRTWVDFRKGVDEAFHRLLCGVKGKSPGPWPTKEQEEFKADAIERKLRRVMQLQKMKLIEVTIAHEFQRKLVEQALAKV